MRAISLISLVAVCVWPLQAAAQSSSLMRLPDSRRSQAHSETGRSTVITSGTTFAVMPPEDESRASTLALEAFSPIAIPRIPPRKFKPQDLITIIVRQQKKHEASSEFEKEKKWDIDGKLSEWFRFHPHNRLGTDQLSAGKPGFKFALKDKLETEGDIEREDKFVTRVQARIIDVKPNGNLVLEAKHKEQHDEEISEITLTGICRSDDVTPDNTILSTQVAELVLVEKNQGAVRDATRRGWIPRILDWLRPF